MFKKDEHQTITNRLKEDRKVIQVLIGPRQVGKSTVVKQVLQDLSRHNQFFSDDNVPATNSIWVSDCWTTVRNLMQLKRLPLGCSRVLLEKRLSESLSSRFEEIRMTHWSYTEMQECFGFTLEQDMYYGGYPSSAPLIGEEDRYSNTSSRPSLRLESPE